jgi:pimeloyl-ACP methyl ester carboxylesterase
MCLLVLVGASSAQTLPSRPVLFAHGFCGSALDFQPLIEPLYQQLPPNLYPSSTVYYAFYNSINNTTTFLLLAGGLLVPVDQSSIPSSTRFFSIMFYDPNNGGSTDPNNVAKISILNKAYELSQVIKQVTSITKTKDVIIVAHSIGGLDARSYVENLASPGVCYDYQANQPEYSLQSCTPGAGNAAFAGDVADIITVDTPHPGDPLAELNLGPLGPCFSEASVNRTELNFSSLGGAGLVEALNYNGSPIAGVLPSSNAVSIQAVQDYFSDVTDPWTNFGGWLTGYSDDIVLTQWQSILLNLPASDTKAPLADVPVSYLSSDPSINSTPACWILGQPVLHFMTCLGAQPNTQNAIAAQVNAHINSETITLTVTDITSDSAVLNGTVDPNGSPGYVYFYWGTSATNMSSSCEPGPVATTYTAQAFSCTAGDLQPNTTYYFQIAFMDANNGVFTYGNTLNFLVPLPKLVTKAASSITSDSAVLNGTVNPHGSPGYVYFYWGTSATKLRSSCEPGPVATTYTAQAFSCTAGDLQPNTTYYFRIAFRDANNGVFTYGSILKALVPQPVLVTQAASSITSDSAVLNGTVDPNGSPGYVYFYWGTSATNMSSSCEPGPVATTYTAQAFSCTAGNLQPNTTYYFQIAFMDANNGVFTYGGVQTFPTLSGS